ncbi:hypothetical protein RYX56_00490 [Alkalihalophilus lindianensis]|uniref:Uncharacterized protein n=1 Tax=Alkalihalophilus lindianensis TaxID=1630542 RepID=A0ABU3X4M0_9BACI|nr:hypothetical protein [Alkalihalophilus lindianensis]MDV2682841.1 hypothetical protein [Alkalihalophilus lindianensis]
MKKKPALLIGLLIIIFLLLHSTPSLALRTHVLVLGYPKAAVTSGIVEDDYHNEVDKEAFEEQNAKAYTLTEPPIEKSTQGQLSNFLVKKIGFLYFAEFYGDG